MTATIILTLLGILIYYIFCIPEIITKAKNQQRYNESRTSEYEQSK